MTLEGKKILILAFHFPPVSGRGKAGAEKAYKLVKYLKREGLLPLVITLKTSSYPDYIKMADEGVETLNDLYIFRTGRIPYPDVIFSIKESLDRRRTPRTGSDKSRGSSTKGGSLNLKELISNLLRFPDAENGWIIPLVTKGIDVIRQHRGADLIFATSPPFSTLIGGVVLKSLFKIPLVTEFRDPFVDNPYRSNIEKDEPFHSMRRYLEKTIVQRSDLILLSSDEALIEMKERYPLLERERLMTFSHGFDPDDFKGRTIMDEEGHEPPMTILHAGFLYGRRTPMPLLRVLADMKRREEIREGDIRFVQVGETDLPFSLNEESERLGIGGMVVEIPHIPHKEVIKSMLIADILLLLQQSAPLQVPSKLYEYAATGRRILAITDRGSAVARLVEKMGRHVVVEPDDEIGIRRALLECLEGFRNGELYRKKWTYRVQEFSFENSITEFLKRLDQMGVMTKG